MGISCWPPTWGRLTFCGISEWVPAAASRITSRQELSKGKALQGEDVASHVAFKRWNLFHQRLPLCQFSLLESEQENVAFFLVARISSSPCSGAGGSRGQEMPTPLQTYSLASSYLNPSRPAAEGCLSSTCCRDSLAPNEKSCQQGLLWCCSRVVLPRGPTMGATDGPMVSTEQWWGRGLGIACPKQEALTELQRTGRAKGLSGGVSARIGGCMNCLLPSSLDMPSPAAWVRYSGQGSQGLGTGWLALAGHQPDSRLEGRGLEAGLFPSSGAPCHLRLQVLYTDTVVPPPTNNCEGRAGTGPVAHSLPASCSQLLCSEPFPGFLQ